MATTVKEIIGSAYILLNNASEEELDLAVALTQYGITLSEMQHELISGYRNPEIKKITAVFPTPQNLSFASVSANRIYLAEENNSIFDGLPVKVSGTSNLSSTTFYYVINKSSIGGVTTFQLANSSTSTTPLTITDDGQPGGLIVIGSNPVIVGDMSQFDGDIVLIKFNDMTIPDVPFSMLQEYRYINQQAVAFYTDTTSGAPQLTIELSQPTSGTLDVWYEPRNLVGVNHEGNSQIDDAFKYFMATRLAGNLINYVLYNDPRKEAAKQLLLPGLLRQSSYAKDLYIAAVNKSSNNSRPFSRLPYNAR